MRATAFILVALLVSNCSSAAAPPAAPSAAVTPTSAPTATATPSPSPKPARERVLEAMQAQSSVKVRNTGKDGQRQYYEVQMPDRLYFDYHDAIGTNRWLVVGDKTWHQAGGTDPKSLTPWQLMDTPLYGFRPPSVLCPGTNFVAPRSAGPPVCAQSPIANAIKVGQEIPVAPCSVGMCGGFATADWTVHYDTKSYLVVDGIGVSKFEYFDYGIPNDIKPPQ